MHKTFDQKNHSWLQFINPTHSELAHIAKEFFIPLSMLNQHNAKRYGTTIECHADLFSFVIELPILNDQASKVPFGVMKLSIIVIDNVVITISEHDHEVLSQLSNIYKSSALKMNTTVFMHQLFALTVDDYLNSIQAVSDIVENVERKLQTSISNQQVFDLLNNNKSYLSFIRALKHNGNVLNDLVRKRLFCSNYKSDAKMMDIIIANEQTQKKAEIYNANLRNLMDAYSAAIENNLSLAVQYLTVFVTIAAIPMGIAGIFGMNIPLPFQSEPWMLLMLGISTGVIAIAVWFFFKVRRYI